MSQIANILNPTQLQLKDLIMDVVNSRLSDKEKVNFTKDTVKLKRKDWFQIIFIGGAAAAVGEKNFKFFNVAQSANAPYMSNFNDVAMADNNLGILAGLILESATGAAAGTDDVADLDFATITDGEILNGLISQEISGRKVLEENPIRSLISHDDVVPNFYRYETLELWKPGEKIPGEIRLADGFAAAAYEYLRITAVGWVLE